MYGYAGKILRVNLSTGKVSTEELDPEAAEKFIGGRGLATKVLLDEIDPTVDPLSPRNKVIFATGPLTGTLATSSGRYMVVTKSPLTGAIACSNSGGFWGPELKFAGFDMVIVEGRARNPLYLWIENDRVELRPADHIWGKTSHETEDILHKEVGWEAKIACVGPAGEKGVKFACVVNDKHRAAGRSGVGAAMGAKRLKAIAVRGTNPIKVADPEELRTATLEALEKIKTETRGLTDYGTANIIDSVNEHGFLPTRNFQTGVFPGADKINGVTIAGSILVRPKACFGCAIACARPTITSDPKYRGRGEGPEYETVWALGADCGVDDLAAIAKANYICNELGMDTISMGATLACAMELYQRGYISAREVGRTLNFGDAGAVVEMVEKTGLREGFGDALAEGAYSLAHRYGHPELFMGSKKQEFPAYDPRGAWGMGLNYATSNRGACHVRGFTYRAEISGYPRKLDPFSTKGKAEIDKAFQDVVSVIDSAGMCLFVWFAIEDEDINRILRAATGFNYTVESMLKAGERIWNAERIFNLRAGFTKEDDSLPDRITKEPLPEGPSKGKAVNLEPMLAEYYKLRGWTSDGVPTEEKLRELRLST
ncbi:MAG: aldehyde ferredoxin oxidoreductase family protein [bacterium]